MDGILDQAGHCDPLADAAQTVHRPQAKRANVHHIVIRHSKSRGVVP